MQNQIYISLYEICLHFILKYRILNTGTYKTGEKSVFLNEI